MTPIAIHNLAADQTYVTDEGDIATIKRLSLIGVTYDLTSSTGQESKGQTQTKAQFVLNLRKMGMRLVVPGPELVTITGTVRYEDPEDYAQRYYTEAWFETESVTPVCSEDCGKTLCSACWADNYFSSVGCDDLLQHPTYEAENYPDGTRLEIIGHMKSVPHTSGDECEEYFVVKSIKIVEKPLPSLEDVLRLIDGNFTKVQENCNILQQQLLVANQKIDFLTSVLQQHPEMSRHLKGVLQRIKERGEEDARLEAEEAATRN